MILKVENLRKSYGKKIAVDGISFEVNEGEVFALLGPNGAGKTTTIKCIIGLRKPDEGRVTLVGKYSYLPERKELYRWMKVFQMIDIASSYTRDLDVEKALDFLKQMKMNPDSKVAELSHGELTILYTALTIFRDANVYILDEPTWGLDPVARSAVFEIVLDLSASGKSVLYTSHVIPEVEKVASRVAIMVEGKIVETGEIDELKERYAAVHVEKGKVPPSGYLYKETSDGAVYVVRKEIVDDGEPVSFSMIVESIIKAYRGS